MAMVLVVGDEEEERGGCLVSGTLIIKARISKLRAPNDVLRSGRHY